MILQYHKTQSLLCSVELISSCTMINDNLWKSLIVVFSQTAITVVSVVLKKP